MSDTEPDEAPRKRKSGIPTGNAGEYLVMGELLRRGFDAQLADRNTKGYDVLVGEHESPLLQKVQVKSVRAPPWYIRLRDFEGDYLAQITIYVLVGKEDALKPVRYFIARNMSVMQAVHQPKKWENHGSMALGAVLGYEDRWEILKEKYMPVRRRPISKMAP